MIENKKKLRKYEVEIQVVKAEVYSVYAKDDADIVKKNKSGLIRKEGRLIGIDVAENMMSAFKNMDKDKKNVWLWNF